MVLELGVVSIIIVTVMPLLLYIRKGLLSPIILFYVFISASISIRSLHLIFGDTQKLIIAPWVLLNNFDYNIGIGLIELSTASLVILASYQLACLLLPAGIADYLSSPFVSPLLSVQQRIILFLFASSIVVLEIFLLSGIFGTFYSAIVAFQRRAVPYFAGLGYLTLLTDFVIVAVAFLISDCYRVERRLDRPPSIFWWTSLSILTGTFLALSGGRAAIIQFVFILIIIRYNCRKHLVFFSVPLALLAILSVGIILSGYAARISFQFELPFATAWQIVAMDSLTKISGAFTVIDQYMLAKVFAEQNGYDYGAQFLNYLTRVIPRGLWEEKPLLLGVQIRQLFWGDLLSGTPPTVFGEFYIAFGIIGLLSGSIIVGMILALLQRIYVSSLNSARYASWYAIFATFGIFTTVRSGLEIGLIKIVGFMAIFIFWNIILKFAKIMLARRS